MRGAELFLALPWLYLLLAIRAALPLNIGPAESLLLVIGAAGLIPGPRFLGYHRLASAFDNGR